MSSVDISEFLSTLGFIPKSQDIDLGAMAMALQLSAIMDKLGRVGDPDDLELLEMSCPYGCHQCTADWLRECVQREMWNPF